MAPVPPRPIARPEDAPPPDYSFLVAARYNDAEAEDHGLKETLEKHGVNYEYALFVAEQRALRIVMIRSGRHEEMQTISGQEAAEIELSAEERAMVTSLLPICLDALFIGYRARQIEETGDGPTS